jgi:putative two-component system response regulator
MEQDKDMADVGGFSASDAASLQRVLRAARSCAYSLVEGDDGVRQIELGKGLEALAGYSAEEFRAQPDLWWSLVHEEDREQAKAMLAGIGEHGAGIAEYRIVGKGGEVRWIRNVSTRVPRDVSGERAYEGLLTDVTERRETEQKREELLEGYRKMVSRDPLTGLLNRTGMFEELERLWNLSRRHPFPIGALVVDIDHFKAVNDTLGHMVGDVAIKECAGVLQSILRDTDSVCRYGGDELVAILPWSDIDQTRRVGERIRKEVSERTFAEGVHDLRLTVSIGAHSRTPLPGEKIEPFLKAADGALYRAKQEGRNRVCVVGGSTAGPRAEVPLAAEPEEGSERAAGYVMVVDDEPSIRKLAGMMLKKQGFQVWEAGDPEEAMAVVEREKGRIDLAFVDLTLGTESGFDLIARIKKQEPILLCIVITGDATMDRAVESMRVGAYDFLKKPFRSQDVALMVGRAMEQRRLLLENRRYHYHLEAMVQQRGRSLAIALDKIKESHQSTLEAMASLIDAREKSTGQHCLRVSLMANILAEEMKLPMEEMEPIRTGALLHDIGKIAIPDAILLKPGPLNDEEWAIMKTHPKAGYDIISGNSMLKEAAQIVLWHHEKYDGTGYPDRLKGEDIYIGARIFSVVDSYDAIRAKRSYSDPKSAEVALAEIQRCKGGQFDPSVVDAFAQCQARIEEEVKWV